jgi:misacylated tRNA(Ala) deacylase
LDFNLPDTSLDKNAITSSLNDLIAADYPLTASWIDDAELDASPNLVRTMSVKPPSGQGRVRVIDIAGVDIQPCGGTHVRSTGEVGPVRIGKIENKGRQNRRINVYFDDGT